MKLGNLDLIVNTITKKSGHFFETSILISRFFENIFIV